VVEANETNTDCSSGWQSNFGNEYCFNTEEESHAEARDICHDMNSELASITSDEECDYVTDHMSVNFVTTRSIHIKQNWNTL